MYPATFFGLFPAFPRDFRAFVAMSFDGRFTARWEQVLQPALRLVEVEGHPLEPYRADLSMSGDSVLTNILDQLSRCRVVVADVTAVGELDRNVVRNQNVFYEVGLAHAVRLPEEVLLFRSDNSALAFDISNVRVHTYDPDNAPDAARRIVTEKVAGSLRELELRQNLAVRLALERLDEHALNALIQTMQPDGLVPPRATLGNSLQLAAISRLLELGVIYTEMATVPRDQLDQRVGDAMRYRATPFGKEVALGAFAKFGLLELLHETARRLQVENAAGPQPEVQQLQEARRDKP